MLLTIDIGNTNIVVAVFEGNNIRCTFRLSSKPVKTADEFYLLFSELLKVNGVALSSIKDAIISSVVPQLNFEIRKFLEKFISNKPVFVSEVLNQLDVKILLQNPAEVGSDRIVNAIAAYEKVKGSAIIIDFGTATTFDVINDNGDYLGGVIAPGVNLSLNALHKAAAKLPKIDIASPSKVVGDSTITAMRSGIFYGYKGMIEGIVNEIKTEKKQNFKVIATGGLARLFAKATDVIAEVDDDLTLEGLRLIHERIKN
jgi:type III pantothenate kinase